MKKKLLSLILAVVFAFSLITCASAAGHYNYVYDETELLDSAVLEHYGNGLLPMLSEQLEFDTRVDIIDGTDGLSIDDCAEQFYGNYLYGQGENMDGILLLMDVEKEEDDLKFRQYTVYASVSDANTFTEENETALRSYLDRSLNKSAWLGDKASDSEKCEQALRDYIRVVSESVRGENPAPYVEPLKLAFEPDLIAAEPDTTRIAGDPVFIADVAGLLSEEEFNELNSAATSAANQYGCGVYIITFEDYSTEYPEMSIGNCISSIYTEYGLGVGYARNAILLLVNTSDGRYAVTGFGDIGTNALTTENKQYIENEISGDMANGNWNTATANYMRSAIEILEPDTEPEPIVEEPYYGASYADRSVNSGLIMGAILVAALIAAVVCLVLKSRNKSVIAPRDANNYIVKNGVAVTGRVDRFTNKTVERIPKNTQNMNQNRK